MLRGWGSTLSWAVAVFSSLLGFCVLLPLSELWAHILLFVCLLRELLRSCLWPWRVNKLISLGRRWLLFLPPHLISSSPLLLLPRLNRSLRWDEKKKWEKYHHHHHHLRSTLGVSSLRERDVNWTSIPEKWKYKLNELKREEQSKQT